MDGVTIQERIYAGRGKAALRIGLDCNQYRPLSAGAPLGNLIATIKAAFNSGDSSYLKPNLYGDPIWFADLDGRYTQVGDYLMRVFDSQTFFIAAQQQMLPIVVVECSRMLRITRQAPNASVGAQPYSGLQVSADVDVLGAPGALWPASILIGGKKVATGTGLPAGVADAGWKLLLPPSVPIEILAGDIATDDLGRRFAIDAAELTDMGWRMVANEVHA